MENVAVIDALARSKGKRYATFDVVGSGPRVVAGIVSEFCDVTFYPYEKSIVKTRELIEKDAVLISAMSTDFHAVHRLVSMLRRNGFKGTVIVGGPISFEYTKLLREIPVDIVVVGEAEIPLRVLFSALKRNEGSLDSVPALAFKEGGDKIKLTSRHVYTPKEVLSSVKPWTSVDRAFDHPQVYRFYVEVVRGCSNFYRPMIRTPPLNCVECFRCRSPSLEDRVKCPVNIPPGCGFCSVPYMFGPPRSRYVKSIVREVSELVSHGARRIVLSAPDFLDYGREELVKGLLTDPCFPPANTNAIENLLCELASIEEVSRGKVVIMIENVKACLVNEETGKVLGTYLKGTTVHIGLETGCNWFNEKVLGKPITLEHVIRAVKVLREYGLRPYVYLMYAIPMATREVYLETRKALHELSRHGVEKITLYRYINLPGTAFEAFQPTTKDHEDIIRELKDTVNKYNLASKRKLVGEKLEVFLLETKRGTYGYPVKHGPVVFVKKTTCKNLSGCRGLVKVTDVSSRFVKGVLISVLECLE